MAKKLANQDKFWNVRFNNEFDRDSDNWSLPVDAFEKSSLQKAKYRHHKAFYSHGSTVSESEVDQTTII